VGGLLLRETEGKEGKRGEGIPAKVKVSRINTEGLAHSG